MSSTYPSMDEKIWGTLPQQTPNGDRAQASQSHEQSRGIDDQAIKEFDDILDDLEDDTPVKFLKLSESASNTPRPESSSTSNTAFVTGSGLFHDGRTQSTAPKAAAFGSVNMPPFGAGTAAPSNSTIPQLFDSCPTPAFGSSATPLFGSQPFGSRPTPAFGSSITSAFGAQPTPAFGSQPAPAFNSAFGSASNVGNHGVKPSAPAFGSSTCAGFGSTRGFGSTAASGSTGGFVEPGIFGGTGGSLFAGASTIPSKDAGKPDDQHALGSKREHFLAERVAIKERTNKSRQEVKAELQKLLDSFDECTSGDLHSAMTKLEDSSAKLKAKLQKPTFAFVRRRVPKVMSLPRPTQQLGAPTAVVSMRKSKPASHKPTITEILSEDDDWKDPSDAVFKYFLRLPFELRELIFEHAMTNLCPSFVVRPTMTLLPMILYPHILPQFCFVSRQWREEAILVYIRRTRLIVHNSDKAIQMIKNFLEQFTDGQGYRAVRCLSFVTRMQRYHERLFTAVKGPHGLVQLCRSITHLVFEIDGMDMIEIRSNPTNALKMTYIRKTSEELETSFHFTSLFELENIKSIKLYCSGWKYKVGPEQIPTAEAVFENLVELLKRGLAQRGRKTEVEAVIVADD